MNNLIKQIKLDKFHLETFSMVYLNSIEKYLKIRYFCLKFEPNNLTLYINLFILPFCYEENDHFTTIFSKIILLI